MIMSAYDEYAEVILNLKKVRKRWGKCCRYWGRRGETHRSPLLFTRLWYKPS